MKGKRSKQEVQEASLLISDLTDESLEKRVAAAKSLRFIAEVLGPERTKSELIPFLRKGSRALTQRWYSTRAAWSLRWWASWTQWPKCWEAAWHSPSCCLCWKMGSSSRRRR